MHNNTKIITSCTNLDEHFMTVVAYDDTQSRYTIKNSWGADWGMNDYCYMPYEYMAEYVYERWIFDYRELKLDNKSPF